MQSEREAVMSQTEQFVLRINTYGPDHARRATPCAEYRERSTR